MKLEIRPANRGEAIWLSSRLRPEDQREVETATGKPVRKVLLKAFDLSTECYSLRFNTQADLVALFGITPAASSVIRTAVPWMLCTSEVGRGAIAIAREAPHWLNKWSQQYGLLQNIVDIHNRLHIRWLRRAGCQFRYEGIIIRGTPFLHFTYSQESKQCVIPSQSSPEPH